MDKMLLTDLETQNFIVHSGINEVAYLAVENYEVVDQFKINHTNILDGQVVCFTGKSDYPRYTMQEIAIKNGAGVSNNITSKTTILVVGVDAGSKLDKAQAKGIPIMYDSEFMEILNL